MFFSFESERWLKKPKQPMTFQRLFRMDRKLIFLLESLLLEQVRLGGD